MKNKKIIIGNWKMNPKNLKEAEKIFLDIEKNLLKIKKTKIVLCVPYVYLDRFSKLSKKIILGAQNAFALSSAAYTGEISFDMLFSFKVKYVILGHSERRNMGENNFEINQKIKYALKNNFTPILCVGEKDRDESHAYLDFIKKQVEECLEGISKNLISKIVIAYEPLWAIGDSSVRVATGEEYREVSIYIRKVLNDKFKISNVPIIYGGSVHPTNVLEFLKEGHADGFLPGRDSLDAKRFLEIVNIVENFK